MTDRNSNQPASTTDAAAKQDEPHAEQQSRREALVAVGKFAAFVAPAAYVLLDATAAQAQPCSQHPSPKPGSNCT